MTRSPPASSPPRRLAHRAGNVLTAACFAFIGHRLWSQIDQLPPVRWSLRAVAAVLASVVLVVAIEAIHSLGWRELARAVVPDARWRQSFAICGRSQVAKYLPGNLFHYAQRTVLARRIGLDTTQALLVNVIDAALIVAASVAVALPGLAAVGLAPLRAAGLELPGTLAVAVAIGAAAVGAALLLARPGRALLRQARAFVPWPRVLRIGVLNVCLFLIAGVTVHLIAHGLWPGAVSIGWLGFTWGYALAFTAGFITPGAPGGLGVRELVLFALYEQTLGAALAAGLFLTVRLVYVLGDILTFLTATWIGRYGQSE